MQQLSAETLDLLNAAKYAIAGLPRGLSVLTPEAPGEIQVVINKLSVAVYTFERVHNPTSSIQVTAGSTGS